MKKKDRLEGRRVEDRGVDKVDGVGNREGGVTAKK